MADDAILIDHESDAIGKQAGEAQDAVGFGNYFVRIAQQRKACAGFFRELAVPFRRVEADAQNLRAGGLKFGDIRLISLDLASSTRSGGARVKRQDHGFLAVEVGKLHSLAVLVRQREIGSAVAHLQVRGCTKQWHQEYAQPGNDDEFSGSAQDKFPSRGGYPSSRDTDCARIRNPARVRNKRPDCNYTAIRGRPANIARYQLFVSHHI